MPLRILLIVFFSSHLLFGQDTTKHYKLTFDASNVKILSEAYLHYGSNFHDVLGSFQFDSTLFNQRYNDTSYIGTTLRKEFQTAFKEGETPLFHYNSKFATPAASIRKYKINNTVFWGINIKSTNIKDPKKEFYHFEPSTTDHFPDLIFPALQDKKLLKAFLQKYQVGDHRIYFNQTTGTFELELKTKNAFIREPFFPYFSKIESMSDGEIADRNYAVFINYVKELFKTEAEFNKNLIKNIAKITKERQKLLAKKWQSFEDMYMSDEEQKMGMNNWLNYYDMIIEDELKAILNSEPKKELLCRFLRESGYRFTKMDLINQNKLIHFKTNGNTPLIDYITIINLSQNYYSSTYYNNGSPFRVNLTPGDEYTFVIQLSNGDYGVIKEAITLDDVLIMEFKSIPKELVSIKMVSRKSGM